MVIDHSQNTTIILPQSNKKQQVSGLLSKINLASSGVRSQETGNRRQAAVAAFRPRTVHKGGKACAMLRAASPPPETTAATTRKQKATTSPGARPDNWQPLFPVSCPLSPDTDTACGPGTRYS